MKKSITLHSPLFQNILIWVVVCAIGIFFRLYPLRETISGDSHERATLYVITQLRQQVAQIIDHQNPSLSNQEKDILKRRALDETIRKDGAKIRDTISRVTEEIDKQTATKQSFYLLESDSYYYLDLTENIIETGKISDTFRGSKYLNKRMLAPLGHWEPLNLHAYVGFVIYKISSLFKKDIPLMLGVSFTPLVIFSLSIIPFILICRLMECRSAAIFTGGVLLALAPIFVKRSMLGWYDNDPYSLFFSFLIIYFLFKAQKTDSPTNILVAAVPVTISFIAYTFFWQGWVFIFCLVAAAGVVSCAETFFIARNKAATKRLASLYSVIILATFLGVSLSFGPKDFFVLFQEGWKALKNFLVPQLSPWPDIYISVGELKGISFKELFALLGPSFYAPLAVVGLIIGLWHTFRKRESPPRQMIITLFIFTASTFVISRGAMRFALLTLIPTSLCFPIFLEHALKFLEKISNKLPFLNKRLLPQQIILTVLAGAIIFFPIKFLQKTISTLPNPLFNSSWESALNYLKNNSPENSVINTWWPPGHFIKQTAKRRVSFDGATINFPQAYWMAQIFLTSNEREAAGMLRMLNASANQAAEFLTQKTGMKLSSAIFIIEQIVRVNRTTAALLVSKIIPDKMIAQKLMDLTHGQPPPSYLLIYSEFVENNLQLPFIAHWNFEEIEKINADAARLKAVPPRKSGEYIQFLWNLAGGPYKYSGILPEVNRSGEKILFKENISVDLTTMDCRVHSPQYGSGVPLSIFYLEGTEWKEKRLANGRLPYSVVFYKEDNLYHVVLMDRPLAQSMLVRLYFFDGAGLNFFRPAFETSDLTKRTVIKIFEIDWKRFYAEINE